MEAPPVILPPDATARDTRRLKIIPFGCATAIVIGIVLIVRSLFFGVDHSNVEFDVSPDGRRIVFSAVDGDLWLYTIGEKSAARLADLSDMTCTAPAFSPDGAVVVFSAYDKKATGSWLYTVPTDGGSPRKLTTSDGLWDSAPSFSRDGRKIAFSRGFRHRPYSMGGWTWDDFEICVVHADGSGFRQLTQLKYYSAGNARFANEDRLILYGGYRHGSVDGLQNTVWAVDSAVGGEPREITTGRPSGSRGGAWASSPNVGPAGLLAFIADRDDPFAYDVWVSKIDGTHPRALGITGIARYNHAPVFSPDGEKVLFLAGTQTGAGSTAVYSLWEVGVDGKNAKQLADSGLFTRPSRWTKR